MAFGTGKHPTTQGCLIAISKLKNKKIKNVLDLGCGTSILSIATKKKFYCSNMVAIDVDPIALSISKSNSILNNISGFQIKLRKSSKYVVRIGKHKIKYNLILANISHDVLIKMAKDIFLNLHGDGTLIVSGIYLNKFREVNNWFYKYKFIVIKCIIINNWITLVLKKRSINANK